MSDHIEIDINTGEIVTRNYTDEEIQYREYLEAQLAEKMAQLEESN